MKRVPVGQRQTGDIFLAAVPSDLGWAIKAAELEIHPNAPKDFIPTHAGIIGFGDTIVEAWLNLSGEDSVACINPWSKYRGYEAFLELWRPAAFEPAGLEAYIRDYGPEKYGWLNLFGELYIAEVKKLTGRSVENPIENSDFCSQGALIELGKYQAPLIAPQEHWAYLAANDDVVMRDADPLELRMMLLAHEHD